MGKRAWRYGKGAWRRAMLKVARGNTILCSLSAALLKMFPQMQKVRLSHDTALICLFTIKHVLRALRKHAHAAYSHFSQL